MDDIIKNKKIAILGSSPVMIILFYFLKLKNEVIIFEENKVLGGAWKQQKYKKTFINLHSNVVLPGNKKIYNRQIKINTILKKKKIGIKIKKSDKKIFALYKPRKYFEYDFSNMYKKVLKYSQNIKHDKIKKITFLENNQIKLNDNQIFDLVFFPSYFGINHFFYKKKKIKIDFKIIQSLHLSLITNKISQKLIYSDFYNQYFDRINMHKFKEFFHLTARVSKTLKKSKLKIIKEKFTKTFPNIEIKKIILNKYKNYYRDKYQLDNLKKKLYQKKITYVNTTSFLAGINQIINLDRKY